MKSLTLIGAFLIAMCTTQGQSRVALTPGTAAHPSSILDLRTTQTAGSEKGFLMTRMDSAQKVNLPAPANSLWVYQNKEDTGFFYYDTHNAFNAFRRAQRLFGTVQMDNITSIRLNNTQPGSMGYTVEHLAPGIDEITFSDFIGLAGTAVPEIIVSGENTEAPLQIHENASVYCVENYNPNNAPAGSISAYVNSVTIMNGATTLIQNIGSGAEQTSYYSHSLLDNSINDCISQGDVLNFTVQPFGNPFGQRLQVWIDWNADGNFDIAETEFGQGYTTPAPILFNVTVPAIPLNAQAKFTAVRIMARSFQTGSNVDGCVAPQSTAFAEVEDYYIPLCSNSGNYPILKPFCSVSSSDNRSVQVYCQDIDGNPINVKYHFKVHEK